ADQAGREKLAIDRLPGFCRNILAGAEDRHLDMAEPRGLVVLVAHEHIDQMSGAEALAGPVDRGKRLDRGIGSVPGVDRLETGVAIAAIARMGFAKMRQDRLAAAA